MRDTSPETIRFKVSGMTCSGCAAKITSNFQKNPSVASAVIDYATGTGVVSGQLTARDVAETVRLLGYGFIDTHSAESLNSEDARNQSETKRAFRTWTVSLLMATPVVFLSMGPWHVSWSGWAQAILTTLFMAGPGSGFIIRSFKQIRQGYVTMDSLVAIGMVSAWLLSVFLVLHHSHHLYFESTVMIGFFVQSGKILEEWARKKSIGEVERLVRLRPLKAFKSMPDERLEEQAINEFQVGDHIYVRPGDMLALDARVLEKEASFDESIVTGESEPVVKSAGQDVPAGAVNAGAAGVYLEVTKIGADTTIEQILRLVDESKLSKAAVQKFADKISAVFVPVVIIISILTFAVWFLLLNADVNRALMIALSVIVVACPCALGLATPVAWVAGLGRAAKAGILVRSYEALEALRSARVIVFDKTGTLTKGQPEVFHATTVDGVSFQSVRTLEPEDQAAIGFFVSALVHSSHPHARALSVWLKDQTQILEIPSSKLIREVVGEGVECEVTLAENRHVVRYGKIRFVTNETQREPVAPFSNNHSVVAVAIDDKIKFFFELVDCLKEDALECLSQLNQRGLQVCIASGDKASVIKSLFSGVPLADATAENLSSAGKILIKADMTPLSKRQFISDLQKTKRRVAFVGDGINDAPALALADVGVAMGSGSDLAANNSGLVLTSRRVLALVDAIELSGRITKIINQNFFWAFAYNIAAIPLAVAGFMNPMWASAAMALSSVSVVINAMRLSR